MDKNLKANKKFPLIVFFLSLIYMSYTRRCGNKVLFGTKTPYSLVENTNTTVNHPPGCKPIQINMVYRHGNRYPTRQDVRKMNPLIKRINDEYKKARLQGNYESGTALNISFPLIQPFEEEWDTHLSDVGEKEMHDIGKRLKIRYPSLFSKPYSPMDYSFKSSCKLRCTHSSNALASGIFEENTSNGCKSRTVAVDVLPCNRDFLMRFLDNCPKYLKKVIAKRETYYQDDRFARGPEVKEVIQKVKRRLGLPNLKLKHYDLHMLFTMCSYEIGMFQGSLNEGYCKLFDTEDRRVLEYWYDMRNFYKRTDAKSTITESSSCELFKDIYETLVLAKNDHNSKNYYPRGIFRSGHSKTIIPFYGKLKLFRDEESLTHINYKQMFNRNFHTGCSSPFSGNIYFVLYKCTERNFKVQMMVNERLMKIPCCDDGYACDFDDFSECYKDISKRCNLKKQCKLGKGREKN